MYTVEELKAAADRLEMMGCELGKTLYEGEGKKFVVLHAFHGDKEKGLAYLVQEADENETDIRVFGARICYIDDLNTGYSQDLEDYKKFDIPSVVKHLKSKRECEARKAREAAIEAERIRFHGFTDSMTPMQKGRVIKCLSKRYHYDDSGIMTRAEHVEKIQKAGGHLSTWINPQGKTEYRIHGSGNGFYVVTKTEYEYFKYLESIDIPF